MQESEYIECIICGGTGSLGADDCYHCDGEGEVLRFIYPDEDEDEFERAEDDAPLCAPASQDESEDAIPW